MKSAFLIIAIIIGLGGCNCPEQKSTAQQTNVEPKPTSDHMLMSTLWFQRSAEMRAAYYQGYNYARLMLDEKLKSKEMAKYKGKKAVVVDVDETVLNNGPFQSECIRKGISYNREAWESWTNKSSAEPLPGALEFLNYAKTKNVEVFYISNRRVNEQPATAANLTKYNFPYVDDNHMLFRSAEGSKKVRRDSVEKNYKILLLIGDNLADFHEKYEDRNDNFGFGVIDSSKEDFGSKFILLPNPMYGDWEKVFFGGNYSLTDAEKDSLRKANL